MTTPEEPTVEPDGYLRLYFKERVNIEDRAASYTVVFSFKDIKQWSPYQRGFVYVANNDGKMYWFNRNNVKSIEVLRNSDEYVIERACKDFREQLDGGL